MDKGAGTGPKNEEKREKMKRTLLKDWKSRLSYFLQNSSSPGKPKTGKKSKQQTFIKPSPEEAQLWSEAFDELLASKYGLAAFRAFLKSEYCEENIEFWLACEDFKKTKSPQKLSSKAKKIYTDFIEKEAPKETDFCKIISQPSHHTIAMVLGLELTRYTQVEIKGFAMSERKKASDLCHDLKDTTSFKRCPNHYVNTTELHMETKLRLDPNPEGDETTYTVHLGGEAKGTCMAFESQAPSTILSPAFRTIILTGPPHFCQDNIKAFLSSLFSFLVFATHIC
ncbi:hypothetical protein MJG53_010952 [Ovis ammon polii x Ovis aries]|uniref:Uncharacterized protein n=1 Tax=Ovis ammon polii x Ovis aries TaxID=2918886 RepID=A0ACB9URE5_9CETA|nr:hypothetical protein MJG53_010952 [Ovis ammon polii x Ovis aries]